MRIVWPYPPPLNSIGNILLLNPRNKKAITRVSFSQPSFAYWFHHHRSLPPLSSSLSPPTQKILADFLFGSIISPIQYPI
ncbi:hypothetical protein L1887_07505 [Cichorium endivia]|nr:hypothetical protein L1887_07505 [Cichorium endivia]